LTAEPGNTAWYTAPGSLIADRGGIAIGRVEYQHLAVPSRPVRLLPRPVFLAGREELLVALHARMSGASTEPRTAALCGLGGSGKTSTAIEYAYRHLAELTVVWLLPAEEPAALAAGFGELAAQLGVRSVLDVGNPVAQVHAALAAHPGQWLLIFDNAPSVAVIQDLLPPVGHGRVLITSQDPHWPVAHVIEVPVLARDVAAAFLQARTGSAEADAARELAAELDGLPLALEQAAAYILATGRTITEYLALFRELRRDLLLRGQPAGYGKQVATTWTLAFDQLEQASSRALALLRLLACFAPDRIPLRLLFQPRPELSESPAELMPLLEDPLAADDALAALRRFCLVSAPQDRMISVHRLVQAVTIDQMTAAEAETWRQAARSLITAALTGDPAHQESWPSYAALLPHAEVALKLEDEAMVDIAEFLGKGAGNFIAARTLCQQVVAASESTFGAGHLRTLVARSELAYLTGEAGDPVAARDQLVAVVEDCERELGPEHRKTVLARYMLARWTAEAGDEATSRCLHVALLPVIERVLGRDDVFTLHTRCNLADWIGADGNPAAARDECAAIVSAHERARGPRHTATISTRANLAYWTGEAGDPVAARDQYAALLQISERTLGANHPDTLYHRAGLARWTGEAGDPVAARNQYAAVVQVSERILGEDHPLTLHYRARLAHWTGKAGDPVAVRDQYAALLQISERTLGANHPDTLHRKSALASWTVSTDDLAIE
jgi:Tetratricopeptide repeat